MKNRHRPVPSFPAATSTIEAQPEAVFHPGTEVLAAEATHHEAVDAAEAVEAVNTTPEATADAPEPLYSRVSAADIAAVNAELPVTLISINEDSELVFTDPVEVLRTPTPPTLKEIQDAYEQATFGEHQPDSYAIFETKTTDPKEILGKFVPAPPLDPLTAHINALLGEEEPEDIDRFEAELNIAAELKTFLGDAAVTLPDGSVRIPVIVPPEMAECIKEWAHGAGEPFDSYLQRMVEMGLNAVVLGGSVAG